LASSGGAPFPDASEMGWLSQFFNSPVWPL
jgi:hypothetical protein